MVNATAGRLGRAASGETACWAQPTYILTPTWSGLHLKGKPARRRDATDSAHLTGYAKTCSQQFSSLRRRHGSLTVPDRATHATGADYARLLLPVDRRHIIYLEGTGRTRRIVALKSLLQGARHVRHHQDGAIDSASVELDLATSAFARAGPSPAGPHRDGKVKAKFTELFSKSAAETLLEETRGPEKTRQNPRRHRHRRRRDDRGDHVLHQHLEPRVLLAAGLLAKKA